MTRLLKSIAAWLCVVGGLALAIEAVARLTWWLSGAGAVSFAQIDTLPSPDREPTSAKLLPRVSEWDGRPRTFAQAPMLYGMKLPPVEERLPLDPLVIIPPVECGARLYGGTWRNFAINQTVDMEVQFRWRLNYDHLVRWDSTGGDVVPNLARSWEVNSDATQYTFHLRRGVRWSDGVPFTAGDIAFWFEHVASNTELTPSLYGELQPGGKPVRFEAIDDYTIRFTFAQPHGLFLKLLASQMWATAMVTTPAHYMRHFHPCGYPTPPAGQDVHPDLRRQMDAGGFRMWRDLFAEKSAWRNPELPTISAWVLKVPPPALQIVAERNPYYWKVDPRGNQLPYIDRVTFDVTGEETINMKAINGEIDAQGRHLSSASYPLIMEKQQSGGYVVRHWGGGVNNSIRLNLNHRDLALRELFGDRRFRIALSLAINREEINKIACYGVGKPRQVCPNPASPYYLPSQAAAYAQCDPTKAAALLDEIGLKRGEDGLRTRCDGSPLYLCIETMSRSDPMAMLVADYWTRAGIKTELRPEARQLFYARKQAGLHDVVMVPGGGETVPILDPRNYFPFSAESDQAPQWATWFQTHGDKGEEPPAEVRQAMELYRRIERTADPAEQVRLFHEILRLNERELWVIGTVCGTAQPFIVKSSPNRSMVNVPDYAAFDWQFRAPGNSAPECFAIVGTRRD